MFLDHRLHMRGGLDDTPPFPPSARAKDWPESGRSKPIHCAWLAAVRPGEAVSLTLQIPPLCRSSGDEKDRVAYGYVETLVKEIDHARSLMPARALMARLHLSGVPSALSPSALEYLLSAVFDLFEPSHSFQFSADVDPMRIAPSLLKKLTDWGLHLAHLAAPSSAREDENVAEQMRVLAQTKAVADLLRALSPARLSVEMQYGAQGETSDSFRDALERTLALAPDRIALVGLRSSKEPGCARSRGDLEAMAATQFLLYLHSLAHTHFLNAGYDAVGFDHFARPSDKLSLAAPHGRLRRLSHRYTDDLCRTQVGFGVGALSHFHQGTVQNATCLETYRRAIAQTGVDGRTGYVRGNKDRIVDTIVQGLLCMGTIDLASLRSTWPDERAYISDQASALLDRFPDALILTENQLVLEDPASELAWLVASALEADATARHAARLPV